MEVNTQDSLILKSQTSFVKPGAAWLRVQLEFDTFVTVYFKMGENEQIVCVFSLDSV